MSRIAVAQEHHAYYHFEVCDLSPADHAQSPLVSHRHGFDPCHLTAEECNTRPRHFHRTYQWGTGGSIVTDPVTGIQSVVPNPMTPARCLAEIRGLEALRVESPVHSLAGVEGVNL